MRLTKFERQLADLKSRATTCGWQSALEIIEKTEHAVEANHLCGRLRDFKVARGDIVQSLAHAIDAHEAARHASKELADRQNASTETRQLLEDIDESLTTTRAFVETEAHEDERAAFHADIEQLETTRRETVQALANVEADWPELSESITQVTEQAELFLGYAVEILDEVARIVNEATA